MPNYFKIGQGNQWLRPASATCNFRILHGTTNSAHCTSPAALSWVGCTKFPSKRFIGYKGNSVQYAVFCCIYSIMRNTFPAFNRSLFSIYKKCTNLYDNAKQDLYKSGITFSFDEKIFSAYLYAYSVDNVTDRQTLFVENGWSFLTDCNPAISHTLAFLCFCRYPGTNILMSILLFLGCQIFSLIF